MLHLNTVCSKDNAGSRQFFLILHLLCIILSIKRFLRTVILLVTLGIYEWIRKFAILIILLNICDFHSFNFAFKGEDENILSWRWITFSKVFNLTMFSFTFFCDISTLHYTKHLIITTANTENKISLISLYVACIVVALLSDTNDTLVVKGRHSLNLHKLLIVIIIIIKFILPCMVFFVLYNIQKTLYVEPMLV